MMGAGQQIHQNRSEHNQHGNVKPAQRYKSRPHASASQTKKSYYVTI